MITSEMFCSVILPGAVKSRSKPECRVQVVSVSSLKGGVGKTSVATGLISAALRSGIRVLAIDLDPHADLSTAVRAHTHAGEPIGTLLRNPRKARTAAGIVESGWSALYLKQQVFPPVRPLHVISGGPSAAAYDRGDLGSRHLRRLEAVLEPLQSSYDLAVIDCPPSFSGLTRMAWASSDDVLLVTEPSLFSVAGTERTLRALKLFAAHYAPHFAEAYVVVNRFREDSAEHRYRVSEMNSMFGSALLRPYIRETSVWQQAQGAAYPIDLWPTAEARSTARAYSEVLAQIRR